MQCPVGAFLTSQARRARATPKRNELPSMSIQFHGHRPLDDGRATRTTRTPRPSAEVVVKGRNVEIPDHFRTYVSEKLSRLERFDRTIYLFDVELDHETQSAPAQELSARRDHRARPRTGRARRGLRRQLLRRAGVGGLQTREPAAPQQGPPQDPLRRQDAGVAGRGHRDHRRPRHSCAPTDSDRGGRRRRSTTTNPAGSCAPRSTRPRR